MKADQIYFKFQIISIPIEQLRDVVREEVMTLFFDHGQKVSPTDSEIVYIVDRCTNILRSQYPYWKLCYFDECLRKGKLDEFDKGQKITMKRLETWFFQYAKYLKTAVWAKKKEEAHSDYSHPRFADNAARFVDIITFRQLRKPMYDPDEWTLTEIEKTKDFQSWLATENKRKKPITQLIYKKVNEKSSY